MRWGVLAALCLLVLMTSCTPAADMFVGLRGPLGSPTLIVRSCEPRDVVTRALIKARLVTDDDVRYETVWRIRKDNDTAAAGETRVLSVVEPPTAYDSVVSFTGFPEDTVVIEARAITGLDRVSHTFEFGELGIDDVATGVGDEGVVSADEFLSDGFLDRYCDRRDPLAGFIFFWVNLVKQFLLASAAAVVGTVGLFSLIVVLTARGIRARRPVHAYPRSDDMRPGSSL